MKVGFIVDGEAEYRSLPILISKISTSYQLVRTLRADLQPYSTSAQIAREVKIKSRILAAKQVDLAVILIDQENKEVCAGSWATEIEASCYHSCIEAGIKHFAVVIKQRCYENWLISDLSALSKSPKRFQVTGAHYKQVQPGKADNVDAQKLLRSLVQGPSYDKIGDAVKIASHSDPILMGQHSRSFRRFLRTIKHPDYQEQSKRPAKYKKQ